MRPLASSVDTQSAAYRENRARLSEAVDALGSHLLATRRGAAGQDDKYIRRHKEAGKLLPRERIEALLDPDGCFLELCALAGHGMKGIAPGGSLIGGVGLVSGVECLITATEATIQGGAMNEISVQKSARLAEIATENGLPSVSCIESAGADLPNQSKIFVPGGRGFREITERSKARQPSVCLVFGSSTAGGAYIPGMSDYVVMVENQAQVFLAGPPLVKMATGEDADAESLGGAAMHSRVSGVSDYLARTEFEAIRLGREIVATLGHRKLGPRPCAEVDPPLHDAEELLGIASHDVRVPFEAREVIARLVDGSRFHEFKPLYGATLVTGWAELFGYRVGILASNGILFSEAANKGAQFIQLCNHRNIPLLFLQNITGFMVGTKYEQEGIIKNGAKLINAVSNSEVPAITLMMGASYGAGNYGMCGRAYAPRFLFTWPNHKIAVMGPDQLAGVLEIIKRNAAQKRGQTVDEDELAALKTMVRDRIEAESDAWFATARLWDDGVIDPRDTRTVLGLALSAVHNAPVQGSNAWGVFRH
ncbi:MAG: acyl-CoA carboxylase subunit beta [Planctomycetota bacterium]